MIRSPKTKANTRCKQTQKNKLTEHTISNGLGQTAEEMVVHWKPEGDTLGLL